MKKTALFALALFALAAGAGAQTHLPSFERPYHCDYSSPWTNERDPGSLTFSNKQPGNNVFFGIETYQTPSGQDNRKIAFAKWQDFCPVFDPDCYESEPIRTRYEFTIKDQVQCTNTVVRDFGRTIVFNGCSNGKTRTCTRQ